MKQGTVTLDINDYDTLLEKARLVSPLITKKDSKITVTLPELDGYINKQILMDYPDFESDYLNKTALVFTKPASNE